MHPGRIAFCTKFFFLYRVVLSISWLITWLAGTSTNVGMGDLTTPPRGNLSQILTVSPFMMLEGLSWGETTFSVAWNFALKKSSSFPRLFRLTSGRDISPFSTWTSWATIKRSASMKGRTTSPNQANLTIIMRLVLLSLQVDKEVNRVKISNRWFLVEHQIVECFG